MLCIPFTPRTSRKQCPSMSFTDARAITACPNSVRAHEWRMRKRLLWPSPTSIFRYELERDSGDHHEKHEPYICDPVHCKRNIETPILVVDECLGNDGAPGDEAAPLPPEPGGEHELKATDGEGSDAQATTDPCHEPPGVYTVATWPQEWHEHQVRKCIYPRKSSKQQSFSC